MSLKLPVNFPKNIIKITFIFVFVATFTFLGLRLPRSSRAASLADFKPGNIISDYTMSNYTSMSVAEIQSFLTSKGNCRNTETYKASWYPSLHYHIQDGHFVCLAEERFATSGTNYGDLLGEGEPSQTAAEIIYEVAQEYKINPQVLIVLLQKEQGLITDSWPNSRQYRSATGYGCPDTAACDSKYYGFKNQLKNAAALFRTVLDGGWTNYPLGNNYIYYNPDRSCGGSTVYIENLATSALYRYTPYQPNSGALAAGYGTATCGAYGNRNFYLYFLDYFGINPAEIKEIAVEAETKFEQTIPDGWYQIYSKVNKNNVIDIRGGIKTNMTSAELISFKKNDGITDNEVFKIIYNSQTGYYNIINPASNLYFDVRGGKIENGTQIIMFSHNSSCNQDWLIETSEDGSVQFISRCSGKAIEVNADNVITIHKANNSKSQRWSLVPVQPKDTKIKTGVYQIAHNDTALDISGGITNKMDYGFVVAYKKNFQENQLFKIEYNDQDGYYRIVNPAAGLNLTAGDKVMVSQESGACSQKWIFETNNNQYAIRSACDGHPIATSNQKVGTAFVLTTNATAATLFMLEEYVGTQPNNEEQESISEDNTYQIRTEDNARTVDISGGITYGMISGNLVAFPARNTNTLNQAFKFKYISSENAYIIYNPASGFNFDVARSGIANGSRVIMFTDNGGYCNQLWRLEKINDAYKIISVCSGKLLSISNIKIGTAYGLAVYGDGEANEQLWKLNAL